MDDFPAIYTVHWPSGPVNACADHASKLRGLAVFMGCHAGITAAPDGAQCVNCQNEHALTQSKEEQGGEK